MTLISRRRMLATAPLAGGFGLARHAAAQQPIAAQQHLASLERRHGGRLGVAILDTATMQLTGYRQNERFPLCSTHKLLAAAFVLSRLDLGQERLDRRIIYGANALVAYSPITSQHAGPPGMTLGALCAAAMTVSDNTAANLLLDSFGGPPALTAYLRTLGDVTTRLDRREPDLNDSAPGDPRDTTTPAAMAGLLLKLVLGKALSAPSRQQLIAWMLACQTGGPYLRAGVPAGWRIGEKTGSGPSNVNNDVGVIWPPSRAPLVVAAYYRGAPAPPAQRAAVLADVGLLAASL